RSRQSAGGGACKGRDMSGILVRRSNLLVAVTDHALDAVWQHNADAITLDLEEGVGVEDKARARSVVKDAIGPASRGAAEVFVRVNDSSLTEDLESSVWPGVRGIMLPRVESAADV